MNTYLIKRNPSFSNTGIISKKPYKEKRYYKVQITTDNKEPYPEDLKIGDMILIAENKRGIYTKI